MSTLRKHVILAALAALVFTAGAAGVPAARADTGDAVDVFELSLEELTQTVFTSSRQEQDARDAAAKVYVITAEQIAASGAQSLDQVLRLVPGFQVRYWLWGFTNTSIRGMVGGSPINERLLWLVDGVPANDVRDAGIWTDQTVFPLGMIQRIEVMPGPHSSVYGSSAFQGVVSIFTKGPDDIAPGGDLSLAYGRHNTLTAEASLPVVGENTRSVLAVQRLATDEHRLVSDHSGKEVTWVRGQTRTGDLTIRYGGRDLEMRYPSIFDTPYSRYSEHRNEMYANLDYTLQLRPDVSLSLLPSCHWWNDRFWDFADVPGLQYEQESYRLSTLAQLRAQFDSRWHLTVATAVHREDYDGNDFHPDHRDLALNRVETFGELAFDATGWLKLNVGASAQLGETVATENTGVHPRAAILTRLGERCRLRGIYSTGYREPSWWHRFINTVDAQGNPDLFAEELTAFEIGLEYDLPAGSVNLNFFSQEVENGILEIYDPALADTNYTQYGIFGKFSPVQAAGIFEQRGIDLSGEHAFLGGKLHLLLSYSYLESSQPDGRATPYDAEHRANAFLTIRPGPRWDLSYGLHAVGSTVDAELEFVPVDVAQPDGPRIGRRPVDAFAIHHVAAAFRPDAHWEFKFGVWDFGNNIYEEYLGSSQRGGLWTFRVGVKP